MIDNRETQMEIAAEVRDLSGRVKDDLDVGMQGLLPTVYGKPFDVYLAELADRIGAAAMRELRQAMDHGQAHAERVAAGNCRDCVLRDANAAKMRSALEAIVAICDGKGSMGDPLVEIYNVANAGLAASPRNCDVYTTNDAALSACHEDRGYCRSPIDERESVISFMLSEYRGTDASMEGEEDDGSK